jgi:hypothetical protein
MSIVVSKKPSNLKGNLCHGVHDKINKENHGLHKGATRPMENQCSVL